MPCATPVRPLSCVQEAVLTKAYAVRSTFEGADMTNAVVDRVDFSNANLKKVKFINAVITGAIFEGADLSGADFEDALIGNEDAKRLCAPAPYHPCVCVCFLRDPHARGGEEARECAAGALGGRVRPCGLVGSGRRGVCVQVSEPNRQGRDACGRGLPGFQVGARRSCRRAGVTEALGHFLGVFAGGAATAVLGVWLQPPFARGAGPPAAPARG